MDWKVLCYRIKLQTGAGGVRCSARVMMQTSAEDLLQQAREYLAKQGGTVPSNQPAGESPRRANQIRAKPKQSASQDRFEGRPRLVGEVHVQAAGTGSTGLPSHRRAGAGDAWSLGTPPVNDLLQAMLAADTQVIGELSPRSEAARRGKMTQKECSIMAQDSNLEPWRGSRSSGAPKQPEPCSSHTDNFPAPQAGNVGEGGVVPIASGIAPVLRPATPIISLLDIIIAGGEPDQAVRASQGTPHAPRSDLPDADRDAGAHVRCTASRSLAEDVEMRYGSAADGTPAEPLACMGDVSMRHATPGREQGTQISGLDRKSPPFAVPGTDHALGLSMGHVSAASVATGGGVYQKGGSVGDPQGTGLGGTGESTLDARRPKLFESQHYNGGAGSKGVTTVSSLGDCGGLASTVIRTSNDAGGGGTRGAATGGGAVVSAPAGPKMSLRERMKLLSRQN